MSELIILRGLPASGKTTWARNWVEEDRGIRVRVNRDDIRQQLFGVPTYQFVEESAVTVAEHAMVESLLRADRDVAVDDTNLRAKYIKNFLRIGRRVGASTEVKDFAITVEGAIERDLRRPKQVGEEVIRRMASKYLSKGRLPAVPDLGDDSAPLVVESYTPNPELPAAVLVDIDGTVATNNGHRGFYDYEKVLDDLPNEPVIKIIQAVRRSGFELVFMSGRPAWCFSHTKLWLDRNVRGHYHGPFMRASKDQRNDAIIKQELFERHVRRNFNIVASFDDRNRVVKAWRNMGLTCLQVADGDF